MPVLERMITMSICFHERIVRFLKAITFTLAIVLCFGVVLSLITGAGVVDPLAATSVERAKRTTYETTYRK